MWGMRISDGRNIAVAAAVVVFAYIAGYLALRQTAAPGSILIRPPGAGTGAWQPYRAIDLSPTAAKWVHRAYWPAIALDRRWTKTVVTVNIP